jgi:hypothetical protein
MQLVLVLIPGKQRKITTRRARSGNEFWGGTCLKREDVNSILKHTRAAAQEVSRASPLSCRHLYITPCAFSSLGHFAHMGSLVENIAETIIRHHQQFVVQMTRAAAAAATTPLCNFKQVVPLCDHATHSLSEIIQPFCLLLTFVNLC